MSSHTCRRSSLASASSLRLSEDNSLLFFRPFFSNEVLNRADFIAGIRMRLPFSIGNLVSGDNPFEGACAAFRTQPQPVAARLGEMVIRDMNVRLGNSRETVTTTSSTTTSTFYDEIIEEIPPPPPEEQEEPQ